MHKQIDYPRGFYHFEVQDPTTRRDDGETVNYGSRCAQRNSGKASKEIAADIRTEYDRVLRFRAVAARFVRGWRNPPDRHVESDGAVMPIEVIDLTAEPLPAEMRDAVEHEARKHAAEDLRLGMPPMPFIAATSALLLRCDERAAAPWGPYGIRQSRHADRAIINAESVAAVIYPDGTITDDERRAFAALQAHATISTPATRAAEAAATPAPTPAIAPADPEDYMGDRARYAAIELD